MLRTAQPAGAHRAAAAPPLEAGAGNGGTEGAATTHSDDSQEVDIVGQVGHFKALVRLGFTDETTIEYKRAGAPSLTQQLAMIEQALT